MSSQSWVFAQLALEIYKLPVQQIMREKMHTHNTRKWIIREKMLLKVLFWMIMREQKGECHICQEIWILCFWSFFAGQLNVFNDRVSHWRIDWQSVGSWFSQMFQNSSCEDRDLTCDSRITNRYFEPCRGASLSTCLLYGANVSQHRKYILLMKMESPSTSLRGVPWITHHICLWCVNRRARPIARLSVTGLPYFTFGTRM